MSVSFTTDDTKEHVEIEEVCSYIFTIPEHEERFVVFGEIDSINALMGWLEKGKPLYEFLRDTVDHGQNVAMSLGLGRKGDL